LSPIALCNPFCLLATTTATLLLHNTGYPSHLNVFIILTVCSDEAASVQRAVRRHKCSDEAASVQRAVRRHKLKKKIHFYIISTSSNDLTLLLATSFTFSSVSVIVALNNKFCLIFGRALKIIFNCWLGERKICR